LRQRKEAVLNKIRQRKGSHDFDLFVELLDLQLEIVKNAIIVESDSGNVKIMQGEAKLCERMKRDIDRPAAETTEFTEV